MDAFSDNFLSGDDFEAVFSVFMTMVKTLLRQLKRSLQMKMIMANSPRVLQFAT